MNDDNSKPDVHATTDAGDGIERGELVGPHEQDSAEVLNETVTAPAKVMRIGSMVKQLLEEVRSSEFDEASRERLAEIYERSIVELAQALSPDLQEELHMLALPFKDGEPPSIGEIRIAKAQLVGWLEGLFHGIQATMFAQQLAARQQFELLRGGAQGGQDHGLSDALGGRPTDPVTDRPGTYL